MNINMYCRLSMEAPLPPQVLLEAALNRQLFTQGSPLTGNNPFNTNFLNNPFSVLNGNLPAPSSSNGFNMANLLNAVIKSPPFSSTGTDILNANFMNALSNLSSLNSGNLNRLPQMPQGGNTSLLLNNLLGSTNPLSNPFLTALGLNKSPLFLNTLHGSNKNSNNKSQSQELIFSGNRGTTRCSRTCW